MRGRALRDVPQRFWQNDGLMLSGRLWSYDAEMFSGMAVAYVIGERLYMGELRVCSVLMRRY